MALYDTLKKKRVIEIKHNIILPPPFMDDEVIVVSCPR